MISHCVYCKEDTLWLVTELPDDWIRFECTKCCKISRDVKLAGKTEEVS